MYFTPGEPPYLGEFDVFLRQNLAVGVRPHFLQLRLLFPCGAKNWGISGTLRLSIDAIEGQCDSVRGNLYNYLGEIIPLRPLSKVDRERGTSNSLLFVLSSSGMDNGQVLTKAGAAQKQARQKQASL